MFRQSKEAKSDAQEALDMEALELRQRGMSYRRIAEELGVPRSTAHNRVTRALDRYREVSAETAEQVRTSELEILDQLLERHIRRIDDPEHLDTATGKIQSLLARKARLTGADEALVEVGEGPQKITISFGGQ